MNDAELISWIALKDGRPLLENLTTDNIDLSYYLDFYYYYLVWYWDKLSGEKGKALPERRLGISYSVGAGMFYWVLHKQ